MQVFAKFLDFLVFLQMYNVQHGFSWEQINAATQYMQIGQLSRFLQNANEQHNIYDKFLP